MVGRERERAARSLQTGRCYTEEKGRLEDSMKGWRGKMGLRLLPSTGLALPPPLVLHVACQASLGGTLYAERNLMLPCVAELPPSQSD